MPGRLLCDLQARRKEDRSLSIRWERSMAKRGSVACFLCSKRERAECDE
jgi:hypothetical protein